MIENAEADEKQLCFGGAEMVDLPNPYKILLIKILMGLETLNPYESV